MYAIAVFALLLFGVFLIFAARQSASVQRGRKYRRRIVQDLSILSILPTHDVPDINPIHEVSYHDSPDGNYASDNMVDGDVSVSNVDFDSGGGDLGSTLADAIDVDANSFSGFDSGSDFGGGGDFSGGSDFGGGGTND
jgi:hypothetical protein